MECIGVSGMPLKFLQNFAPNRYQQVELNANIQYGHQYLLVCILGLCIEQRSLEIGAIKKLFKGLPRTRNALNVQQKLVPDFLIISIRQDNQKQNGLGTSDQSFFRLQNKFRKVPLLVRYYLTKFDDVI